MASFLGITLPEIGKQLNNFIIPLLFILMFITMLKIDLKKLKYINIKLLLISIIISLIIIPFSLYQLANFFNINEDYKFSIFLSAIAPTILSAPYFVSLVKGDIEFSFILSLIITLLFPFVFPLITYLMFSETINIDILYLFKIIIILLIIPLILSLFLKNKIKIDNYENSINIIIFFLFTYILISINSNLILNINLKIFFIAFIQEIIIFFVILYLSLFWLNKKMAKTLAISITIKNTVLTSGIGLLISTKIALVSSLIIIFHIPLFIYIFIKKENII